MIPALRAWNWLLNLPLVLQVNAYRDRVLEQMQTLANRLREEGKTEAWLQEKGDEITLKASIVCTSNTSSTAEIQPPFRHAKV